MHPFFRREIRPPFAYGVAVALVGLSILASQSLQLPGLLHLLLLVFTVAVLGAGVVGGPGPALLAAALAVLTADYALVPPPGSFKLPRTAPDIVAFAAFLNAAAFTAWASNGRRRITFEQSRGGAISSQLHAEARRRELMLELGARALAGAGLEALCRDATAMTTAALDAKHCAVFELAPNAESLTIVAATGWEPDAVEEITIDADVDTQAGYALHLQEPVIVRDTDAETRFAVPAALRARGVRSGIAVRIAGATRSFGVLIAYATSPRTFSAEEAQFISGVAASLGGVYERKRLEAERTELLARDAAHRSAAEMASRRAAFLAQTSTVLDAVLEPETTLVSLARLAVPALADCAVVDLVQEDGHVRRIDVVDIDPARRDAAQTVRRVPPNLRAEDAFARAIRTGQSVVVSELPEPGSAVDPDHQRLMRMLQCQSLLLIPLVARGQTLGLITLASRAPNRLYGAQDLSLAQELAGRAAIALDNARLYREAQAASRAKDEFLATVSHELRTPVNAVLGWAAMLRENRLDEARAQHACDAIARSARAQAQLLEQLLDLSRIISGKLEVNLAPVRLDGLVQAAIDAVRPAADDKKIQVTTRLDHSIPVLIVDPQRVQQVVINLLSNAIKFTPDDGLIRVELRRDDAQAAIVVTDHGVGIKREFLPYVFDRFRQADTTTAGVDRGLGLGLSIVRDIVERHGGTVSAESAGEGKGSTFTVKLPLRSTSEPLPADNHAPSSAALNGWHAH